ncbi:RagB/SusD family nutrient uptake outer membrane protein [Flammeovirga agarivorans]|uniref:RagB/SusD family nutrient uptake outer membrane protein n=1 Tax=Flammeovirga agarivorans TaxID=2726742 RepID=A0A7X8XYP6_9BACT|nr:RagB/SusD family nutrient uptake outer membrane protein [Flammeovirga agarivorans]NLR94412.1 RagB/SusD family nutrient uptake outer membrane protein [Flammeovirga agarivorans]
MKYIIKIFFTVVFLSLLSSCNDFLTEYPVSEVGVDNYLRNDDEVETAVLGIYSGLQDVVQEEYALLEMRSDNAGTRSGVGDWAQFETFTVLTTNSVVAAYWNACYTTIYRSNLVLANIENVADSTKRAQFEGEARFVRGYMHFNLVRLFGNVPLGDRMVAEGDVDGYVQVSEEEVYSLVESDLKFAAENLLSKSDIDLGRANKESAEMMLAQYYLQIGNYDDAKALLQGIIDGGNFSLTAEYDNIFYQELGNEIIFPISFIDDNTDNSQTFSYYFLYEQGSHNYATDNMIALYESQPGTSGEDTRYTTNIVDHRGERKGCGKFLTNSSNIRLAGNDYILLRYSDVLLLYIEALIGEGFQTSDATALDYFNTIRARAGLDPIANITKPTLATERRKEFLYENKRWFDLIRTGDLEYTITNFMNDQGLNFDKRHLLLPIPQREIDTSKGQLSQNPGY